LRERDWKAGITSLAVKIARNKGTDRSYISDSERDRKEFEGHDGLDQLEDLASSGVVEEDQEAVFTNNRRVKKWRDAQAEDADDEEEPEKDEVEVVKERREDVWSPPPNQLDKGKGRARETEDELEEPIKPKKRKRVSRAREDVIEIERDREE
jgi:hypothetical protein